MTAMREEAFELLEKMPEDKLVYPSVINSTF